MLTDKWLLVMRNPQFVADSFRMVVHGRHDMQPPEPFGPLHRVKQVLRGRWAAASGRSRTPTSAPASSGICTQAAAPDMSTTAEFGHRAALARVVDGAKIFHLLGGTTPEVSNRTQPPTW